MVDLSGGQAAVAQKRVPWLAKSLSRCGPDDRGAVRAGRGAVAGFVATLQMAMDSTGIDESSSSIMLCDQLRSDMK